MSLLSTLALLVLPLYRPEGRVAEVEEKNAALREKVSELEKEVAAGKRREETAERGYLNTLHRLANTQHELAYWRESYHRAMSGPQMLGQAQQAQQQLYAQQAQQQLYAQAGAQGMLNRNPLAQHQLGAQGLQSVDLWGEFCNCIPDRNEVFRRTGAAGPIAQ
jgi:hypothetical protein